MASSVILGSGAIATVRLEGGLAVKGMSKALLVTLKQVDAVRREKAALEAALLGGTSPYLARLRSTATDATHIYVCMDAVLARDKASIDLRMLLRGQPTGCLPATVRAAGLNPRTCDALSD